MRVEKLDKISMEMYGKRYFDLDRKKKINVRGVARVRCEK